MLESKYAHHETEIMSGPLKLPCSDRSYLASKRIESLDETEELTPEFRAELARFEADMFRKSVPV